MAKFSEYNAHDKFLILFPLYIRGGSNTHYRSQVSMRSQVAGYGHVTCNEEGSINIFCL